MRPDRTPRTRRPRRSGLTLGPLAALVALAAGTIPLAQPASGADRSLAADDQVIHSDFNSDGYADLAIAAPTESVDGNSSAGAVHVLYGGAEGLRADGSQFFRQGASGVPDAPERGDRFGLTLTAGDFDADGYADLAIGVPREDLTIPGLPPRVDAGMVQILHGSRSGLVPRISLTFGGVMGRAPCTCRFGLALAAGDFDEDGVADLAVGVDDYSIGVIIIEGTRGQGLVASTRTLRTIERQVVGLIPEIESESVGVASLAAGDLDGDGDSELAMGSPRAERPDGCLLCRSGPGFVVLLSGEEGRGVNEDRPRILTAADVGGTRQDEAQFGATLAFGDVGGNGQDELVIGAPLEDVGGVRDAGAVYVVDRVRGSRRWTQGSLGGVRVDAGDRFGLALAMGDFTGDGREELAIGVPYENISGAFNAGIVHVLRGTSAGLTSTNAMIFHQDRPGVAGSAESLDTFGLALAVGEFNGPRSAARPRHDLAIGVPGERLSGRAGAGAVHVLYASSTGAASLPATGSQFWSQGSAGIAGATQAGDAFGRTLR
jgi:hypothetical protein